MCMRSAWKGLCPDMVRRTMSLTMSATGSSRTMRGSRIGRNTGIAAVPPKLPGSICPVTMIVPAAEIRPSCMEPESPMKIVAGWKLWGRKPAHMPMRAATMVAAREV